MGLVGNYRNSGVAVNLNDDLDRQHAKRDYYDAFKIRLRSNPTEGKIDLRYMDKKGGVDVEHGHWLGLYKDQDPQNFNQFTLAVPTCQFQERKIKYFLERHEWINDYGNPKESYDPHYKNNEIIRYNEDYSEFFIVDYEIFLKRLPELGKWSPNTVWKEDQYGNRVVEEWMCWELKDVRFYRRKNGIITLDDKTWADPKNYAKFVEEYRKLKEEYELQRSVH